MLLDYYLTLIGALLHRKTYGENMRVQYYELNPAFQKSVAQIQWFNPRHFLSVIFVTSILILFSETDHIATPSGQFFLGLLIIMFAAINGRHIGNILTFYFILYHPRQLSGHMYFDHLLTLKISQHQLLFLLFPLIAIGYMYPIPFILGGIASVFIVMLHHATWIARYKQQIQSLAEPQWGEEDKHAI